MCLSLSKLFFVREGVIKFFMQNIIFTIVAYNYLGSAITLGNSIKRNDGNSRFIIIIADRKNKDIIIDCDEEIIFSEEIDIKDYLQMAFKYDVTEFATSIKPYCIAYIFKQYKPKKVLYIDPDIYVYERLDTIYDELDCYDALLTPHIVVGEKANEDIENSLMYAGAFNLGFFGVRNNENGRRIVQWWADKLKKYAYSHPKKGFYTDQKWMNLVVAEFGNVLILRDYALNIAWWNFSERNISCIGGKPFVTQEGKTKPAVFFHFSGFKPGNNNTISKSKSYGILNNINEIEEIFSNYENRLKESDYEKYSMIPYGYATYSNKMVISKINRRIYGRLCEEGECYEDPFDNKGKLYNLYKKNGLLSNTIDKKRVSETRKSMNHFSRYEKMIHGLLRILKKFIGINRYEILSRFLYNSMGEEDQIFLIKEVK